MTLWPKVFFLQPYVTHLTQASKRLSPSEWAMRRNVKSIHPTTALCYSLGILDLSVAWLLPVPLLPQWWLLLFPFPQLSLVLLLDIIMPKDIENKCSLLVILWIVTYLKLDISFSFVHCDLFFVSTLIIAFVCSQISHQPSVWFLPKPTRTERPSPFQDYMNSHIAFTFGGGWCSKEGKKP